MAPTSISDEVPLAPGVLLKLVKYSCGAETKCTTNKCGCQHATLVCSVFCSYQKGQDCFSDKTREALQTEDDNVDDDDTDDDN